VRFSGSGAARPLRSGGRLDAPATAIVLDGNQKSALSAVRSLGRQGVRVCVAEAQLNSLSASSKYCAWALKYPDPTTCPDDFRHWLEVATAAFPDGTVLLPMTDVTVPLVLEVAPRLANMRTALPSLESYEAVTDKYRLFQLARSLDVRVPNTALASQSTLRSLANTDWRYPLVIKPRKSVMRLGMKTLKRGVRYVANRAELIRSVEEMIVDPNDELLVQEYISGYGAGVFALYERGQSSFFFAHRRIRETPPSGGVSVLSESVPLPAEGVAATRSILETLRWHGVAMAEYKIDDAGRTWLIEVNARFWGSLQLAVDSGADFPWFVFQIAAGRSPVIEQKYMTGYRLRWWLGDLGNLYSRLRDSRWTPTLSSKVNAFLEFLKPWRPHMRYEFWRWNDPVPSITALRQYLDALASRKRESTQEGSRDPG
jgi:predicted ATP-grasp superfamily ATP-dependent carboligase